MFLAGIYPPDVGIIAGLAVLVVLLLWLLIRMDMEPMCPRFNKKWPPISEDEFIARCHSGVDRGVALRVRRIVSEQLGVPYAQVYPEQNFVNDLDCG